MRIRFELFVQDVQAAADFYTRVLGFSRGKDVGYYLAVYNGEVEIGLGLQSHLPEDHYFQQNDLQNRKGVGVEIVLEVDDLDATYQHIQAIGYPILSPLTQQPWGSRDFRLADPDGYYFRITQRRS